MPDVRVTRSEVHIGSLTSTALADPNSVVAKVFA